MASGGKGGQLDRLKKKKKKRPIGSKATLKGKPVLWAGPDFGWQSPESFEKLKNEGYFAPGEEFARKASKVGQKVGEAVGPWIKGAYDAANDTWLSQAPLQQQIGTATLEAADKVTQGTAAAIQEHTPLGPAGSELAANFAIDLALANVGKVKYGIRLAKNANNARRVLALRKIAKQLADPDGLKLHAGLSGFGPDIEDLNELRKILFDFEGVDPAKLAQERLRSKRLWELLEERANPNSNIKTNAIDRQLAVVSLTDGEDFFKALAKDPDAGVERLMDNLANNQRRLFDSMRGFVSDEIHHTDGLVLTAKDVITQTPEVRTAALRRFLEDQGKVFGDQPGAGTSVPYNVHKKAHTDLETGRLDWSGENIAKKTGGALPPGSTVDEVYQKISKTSDISTEQARRAVTSPEMTQHVKEVKDTIPTQLSQELGPEFDPYATDLTPSERTAWRGHIQGSPKELKQRFSKNQQLLNWLKDPVN